MKMGDNSSECSAAAGLSLHVLLIGLVDAQLALLRPVTELFLLDDDIVDQLVHSLTDAVVFVSLGGDLHEKEALATCVVEGGVSLHLAILHQVALVAQQDDACLARVGPHFIVPVLDFLERLCLGDVVDKDGADCVLVVGLRDRVLFFLARCVPELH